MPSITFIIVAAILSTACSVTAANFARKQGRNVPVWAAATFVLPALLLFLMKEETKKSAE